MTTITLTAEHAKALAALAEEKKLWRLLRRVMRFIIEGC